MVSHNHTIIKQIIPASVDTFAVFAWWNRDDNNPEVTVIHERVPCFALIEECAAASDEECDSNNYGMPNGFQRIVPCVPSGYESGEYIPANGMDGSNYVFIGVHFENDKENFDWQKCAQETYERAIKRQKAKAAKQKAQSV